MGLENTDTTVQTGAENTGQPAAADQAVGTGQSEQLNAFQKFMQGLFGGKDDKSDGPADKKGGSETGKDGGKPAAADAPPDISAIIAAERQKWEAEQQEKARIEKLPPEERAKAEQADKDKQIADLNAQLQQRDLKDAALADLTKDGFPAGLASVLDYSSKENMEKSLGAVKETFKACLTEAINSRLRGPTPEGLGGAESPEAAAKAAIAANIRGGIN